MKQNTVLILVGAGLVGYYLYKRNQAATMLPATAQTAAPSGTMPLLAAPMVNAATVSVPLQGPTVPPAVKTWVDSALDKANRDQFYSMLPTMSQNDLDSLNDIIVNDWGGTGVATTAQRTFWDSWRVKYHILDGTFA